MNGFIKGADRFQATLFPESLDDYVAEESAVRVIDVFVDDLEFCGAWLQDGAERDGPTCLSSGHAAEALHLWLTEAYPVEPPVGTGSAAERGADVIDGPPGAGPSGAPRAPTELGGHKHRAWIQYADIKTKRCEEEGR